MMAGRLAESTGLRQNIRGVIHEQTANPAKENGNEYSGVHFYYYIPNMSEKLPVTACKSTVMCLSKCTI